MISNHCVVLKVPRWCVEYSKTSHLVATTLPLTLPPLLRIHEKDHGNEFIKIDRFGGA